MAHAGVETTEQVEAMFDGITYDKGASVLRMLRAYLTRDLKPQPLVRRRSLLQVRGMLITRHALPDSSVLALLPSAITSCKNL
jgi:hypothetical protein